MTDRLTWLGHATVVIELGAAVLITDPLLRGRVAHLRRRVAPVSAPPRVDAVLISHLHHDHLDLRSVARFEKVVPVVVPRGGARALRWIRRDDVREVSAGDTLDLADVRISAVPAVHDGRRTPLSRPAQALGYVIESRRRVYFAGDTALFDAMAELGDLDAALVPIWGWGPRLGPGHMDPEEAAAAVALIRPRLAVPIHFGTFAPIGAAARHLRRVGDPARDFAARVTQAAPDVAVRVLAPGESVALDGA
jgi:L-ascorbate metabolism protein UlaG (beta-lactamase superfamily)